MTKRHSLITLVVSVVLVVVLGTLLYSHPAWYSGQKISQQYKDVKIGYLNIMAGLPLLVAADQGLFEKDGFKPQLIEFKTGNEVAAAAISGQIDLIGGAATNAVLDSVAESGTKMKIFVLNDYVRRPGHASSSDFLLSRTDIKTVADLKGKKVAIYPGSVGRAFSQLVFPKRGIKPGDIQFVEVAPQQWESALIGGSVDAVTALEPFATTMMRKHDLNILIDGYYAEVMPEVPASGSWFITGKLSPEEEAKIVSVFEDAIHIIETRRDIVNRLFVERLKMSPEDAMEVRLLSWSSVRNAGAVDQLHEYRNILETAGVVRSTLTNADWIWNGL